ncbi:IclR family transcriptional regulator [Williamsia sp. R60]
MSVAVEAESKASSSGDAGVRSVTRVFDLLELFDAAHPTRTLKELVEHTGLPKTTVVRLVATMCARSVLTARNDSSYSLGPEPLRWARLAGRLWTPPDEVLEVMRVLSEQTGETVNLYVRQGLSRIVVAQCESTSTVRSVIPVGAPYPLWAGAAGKILLAAAPELVDAVAAQSPHGPDYGEVLRAAVEEGQARGYVLVHGERELGASGLSCPIEGRGTVMAALTLGGPTGRFTSERVPDYIAHTQAAAAQISHIGLPGLD